MDEAVDGDYQNYKSNSGDYVREHFFGKYPELLEIVADMSDEQLSKLNRGGHDPYKVFAAYAAAVRHQGQPTVILAKTVKGYGLGPAGEAQNYTHSVKKLDLEAPKGFRDRFDLPIPDEDLEQVLYYRPPEDSTEIRYLKACRDRLGGPIPSRISDFESLEVPPLDAFSALLKGSGEREISTTMAFVRLLQILVKDPNIGERIVPIVPDEARTFGMEGMFRQLGIYSSVGQLYEPVDTGQRWFIEKTGTVRSWKRGLMKVAPSLRGWQPRPHTQPMRKRWFLSTFITRCLGFNEWGTSVGRLEI